MTDPKGWNGEFDTFQDGEPAMIDTKRLATDAAYWDSVAPEGATHCRVGDCKMWLLYSYGIWYFWDEIKWCGPSVKPVGEIIPRPQSEWVGGLPPIGIQCEVLHLGRTWRRAGIVAHVMSVEGEKAVWQLVDYSEWGGDLADKFRPILTKAQRDRDELVDLILAEREKVFPHQLMPKDLAEAILSRYTLESKP